MVLGAGRGPLVRRALSAARSTQRKVRFYALEKNRNAIVTLMAQKEELWGDVVSAFPLDTLMDFVNGFICNLYFTYVFIIFLIS